MKAIVGSVAVVAIVAAVVISTSYSCQNAREAYWAAYEKCVAGGGSWVPTGGNESYKAVCVATRQ